MGVGRGAGVPHPVGADRLASAGHPIHRTCRGDNGRAARDAGGRAGAGAGGGARPRAGDPGAGRVRRPGRRLPGGRAVLCAAAATAGAVLGVGEGGLREPDRRWPRPRAGSVRRARGHAAGRERGGQRVARRRRRGVRAGPRGRAGGRTRRSGTGRLHRPRRRLDGGRAVLRAAAPPPRPAVRRGAGHLRPPDPDGARAQRGPGGAGARTGGRRAAAPAAACGHGGVPLLRAAADARLPRLRRDRGVRHRPGVRRHLRRHGPPRRLRALGRGRRPRLPHAVLLPIAGKWLLVGRWRERDIPVWSLDYFRFWLVKTMIRGNPLVLFLVGTPLYPLYLRALGARVGRDVVILTRHVPVCTDLITIGSGSVIRKDVHLSGAAVRPGAIRLGPVTLGRDVVAGERSVLDVGTAMGDGAQLGHASALHAGQTVPAGARFHGSPAVATWVDHARVPPARVGRLRKAWFSLLQVVKIVVVYLPVVFGGLVLLLVEAPRLRSLIDPGPVALNKPLLYLDALVGSAIAVFGGLLVAFVLVTTMPRLLGRAVRPGRTYPLYGAQYGLYRAVARLTNVKTLVGLFGDSSFIVGYLRALGYDLGRVVQTGSNFGSAVSHDSPYLTAVGSGTMVADGLSVVNADVSATSFRINPVAIGADSFLGNHIAYPAGARVGDDCLLATKVMVPLDGPVRAGVGLLGSPAFEIPRSVRRDLSLEVGPAELRRRLRRKNLHNLVTLVLALLVRWVYVGGLLLMALVAVDAYPVFGPLSFSVEVVASLAFTLGFHVLVERIGGGFRRRRPQSCSIYDRAFWRHERYWKLVVPQGMDRILAGTPWKNVVTRLLGARIGRRVLDNGASMTERTLLTIGDDVLLDEGSILQCHSQEDGAFKSDRTALGAGVTVGAGALVHYGVTVGEGAVIATDSFLMKGEEVPAGAHWGGNPAHELPRTGRADADRGATTGEGPSCARTVVAAGRAAPAPGPTP